MADNLQVTTSEGATSVAADEIAGVKHQRMKLQHGVDGAAADVSATNPLPSALYDTGGAPITSSLRGSVGEKLALDVASASALFTLTMPAGTGTRYSNVVDGLNYMWWTGSWITSGSGGSLALEGSHDSTTWITFPIEYLSTSGGVGQSSSTIVGSFITAGYTFHGPLTFRYLRLRATSTVTGTYNMQVALSSSALVKNIMSVTGSASAATDVTSPGSAVDANALQVFYNGVTWSRMRAATTFRSAAATAVGNTALWTPAASKKFRRLGYRIEVSGNVTQTTGGDFTVSLYDGASNPTAFVHHFNVPTTGASSGALGGYTTGWIDTSNGLISALANNVLNINLSAALTSGTIRVIVKGNEE